MSLAVRVPLRDRVVAESELRVVPRVTALEAPHVPQLAFDVHLLVRGVHILAAVLALCVRTTPQLLPRLLHLFRLRRGGINRRCTTHAWRMLHVRRSPGQSVASDHLKRNICGFSEKEKPW